MSNGLDEVTTECTHLKAEDSHSFDGGTRLQGRRHFTSLCYRPFYGRVSVLPCWGVNLAVFYLEQLSEQCYGGRIHMKTVELVHSEFPDFICLSQGIQNMKTLV